jgi:hypothetical protein
MDQIRVLLLGNKLDLINETDKGVTPFVRDQFDGGKNFTFAEVSFKFAFEEAARVV